MDYYKKYQKYKFKYLNLLKQFGGKIPLQDVFDKANKKIKNMNGEYAIKEKFLEDEMLKYGYIYAGVENNSNKTKYKYDPTQDITEKPEYIKYKKEIEEQKDFEKEKEFEEQNNKKKIIKEVIFKMLDFLSKGIDASDIIDSIDKLKNRINDL
jgi:hypothetical protein